MTNFVTFRLGDSIPEAVRREWEYEQNAWLKAHGIGYDGEQGAWRKALEKLPAVTQGAFHKHFNRQVQACLDRGLGECHLRKPECIDIVRGKLLDGDGGAGHVGDFVIMPNHVHALITPTLGHELEMILKQIKGASAVACNRALARGGTFWQAESYDHIVRSLEQLLQYRQYIADNPEKAGITLPATSQFVATWMDDWFKS